MRRVHRGEVQYPSTIKPDLLTSTESGRDCLKCAAIVRQRSAETLPCLLAMNVFQSPVCTEVSALCRMFCIEEGVACVEFIAGKHGTSQPQSPIPSHETRIPRFKTHIKPES